MASEKYITIPRLAELLGISRIAVYRKIKSGEIPSFRIGRTFVISDKTISTVLGKKVSDKAKTQIDTAVRRIVKEYGEVLKKLARER